MCGSCVGPLHRRGSLPAIILQREKKEADRKRIEAEGVRDAQRIIKEGITEGNIEWRSLEVLKELSSSPNAKIIITDGKTPVLINND